MQVDRYAVTVTTDTGGAATVFSPVVTGRILGLVWVKPGSGGITGATLTFTAEATGESILAASSISASTNFYPRVPTVDNANGAALYAAAGKTVNDPIALAQDRVKLVVASGGNTLTATLHIIVG